MSKRARVGGEPRRAVARACRTTDVFSISICVLAVADRIETESRASLLQRGFRLSQPKIEVSRRQARDHLPPTDCRAEIGEQFLESARDLQTEHHLLFGGQRAGHADRSVEGRRLHPHDAYRLGHRSPMRCHAGRCCRRPSTGGCQGCEDEEEAARHD